MRPSVMRSGRVPSMGGLGLPGRYPEPRPVIGAADSGRGAAGGVVCPPALRLGCRPLTGLASSWRPLGHWTLERDAPISVQPQRWGSDRRAEPNRCHTTPDPHQHHVNHHQHQPTGPGLHPTNHAPRATSQPPHRITVRHTSQPHRLWGTLPPHRLTEFHGRGQRPANPHRGSTHLHAANPDANERATNQTSWPDACNQSHPPSTLQSVRCSGRPPSGAAF